MVYLSWIQDSSGKIVTPSKKMLEEFNIQKIFLNKSVIIPFHGHIEIQKLFPKSECFVHPETKLESVSKIKMVYDVGLFLKKYIGHDKNDIYVMCDHHLLKDSIIYADVLLIATTNLYRGSEQMDNIDYNNFDVIKQENNGKFKLSYCVKK